MPMTSAAATVVAVLLAVTLMVPLSSFVRSQINEPAAVETSSPAAIMSLIRQ